MEKMVNVLECKHFVNMVSLISLSLSFAFTAVVCLVQNMKGNIYWIRRLIIKKLETYH